MKLPHHMVLKSFANAMLSKQHSNNHKQQTAWNFNKKKSWYVLHNVEDILASRRARELIVGSNWG